MITLQENTKVRKKGRKDFEREVRGLAHIVKSRDPRWKEEQIERKKRKQEEEKRRKVEEVSE